MLSKFSFGFNKLWDNSKDNGSSGVPPNGPLPTGRAPLKPAQVHLRHDQIVERAMQADNLVEHGLMAIDKRVSIVGEIINLSEGRDKIFKIFSSLLKLVRWCVTKYFMHYTFSKEILNRLKGASSATSTARAFLKLFTVCFHVFLMSALVRLFLCLDISWCRARHSPVSYLRLYLLLCLISPPPSLTFPFPTPFRPFYISLYPCFRTGSSSAWPSACTTSSASAT